MTAHNIDNIENRHDELTDEYVASWHVHNDAIAALPADASLRGEDGDLYGMDARRVKAAELTRDALAEQESIAAELVENASAALDWADGVLDSGDYSDGLDGLDREALTRVYDRAAIKGNKRRALAAAQLLDADGDPTALPRLSANYEDVRIALDYLDAYRDPNAVLDNVALKMSTVRMPEDSRIAPTREVAQQHAREDAERQAAEEAARLEARQALHAEMSRTVSGGKARSVESLTRVRRAPYGYGG
jgi:hypothetical protein